MDIRGLIEKTRKAGIYLYIENDRLAFKAKKGAFSPELKRQIGENKEIILAYLKDAENRRSNRIKPLDQETYPVSYSQRRLYFLDCFQQSSANYNLRVGFKLIGPVNVDAIQQALNLLVERHNILRSRYFTQDDEVYLQITEHQPVAIDHVNLSDHSADEQDALIKAHLAQEAGRDFDLHKDSLLAGSLLTLSDDELVVLLTIHHIATDGSSMTILTREFMQLYVALCAGEAAVLAPLPFQFGDFAAWQRGEEGSRLLEEQLTFWLDYLADTPTLHKLPIDYTRPDVPDYVGLVHRQKINAAIAQKLETLAEDNQTTLFVVVKAIFTLLFSRYSGESDIVLGAPVTGRNVSGTELLVGFFANTLVYRHQIDLNHDFVQLVNIQKLETLKVLEHQDVPFELLVDRMDVERNIGFNPLIQVFMAFQNYDKESLNLGNVQVQPLQPEITNIKFDLELTIVPEKDGLTVQWSYSKSLFHPSTIARMSDSLNLLCEQIAQQFEFPLSELEWVPEADKKALAEFNYTARNYTTAPLPVLVTEQAARIPEAVALSDAKTSLTYRQLSEKSTQLAAVLQSQGVKQRDLVGIYLSREVDLVVAILAIMRCGAAYVPMDPAYPKERLQYIAEFSDIQHIVTKATYQSVAPSVNNLILIDDLRAANTSFVPPVITPDMLAYVIFTSGSTGKPKGVMVRHAELANFNAAMTESLDLSSGVWLSVTAFSFDISILELLCPLTIGFTVVVGDHARYGESGGGFSELIVQHQVTHFQSTPSLMKMYLELPEFRAAIGQLKAVLLGGEPCEPKIAQEIQNLTSARLYNMYGPTETTIWSTCGPLLEIDRSISIGRPIGNTRLYILDKYLCPVPLGVVGELYIAGDGLAKGYLNNAALTQQLFIEDAAGEKRLYRTGDLARFDKNGRLFCLGRNDAQVKIRGYRIELGEIEYHLQQLPQVSSAAVKTVEVSGELHLIAYLVTEQRISVPEEFLAQCRARLEVSLTSYMLPSNYVFLSEMPMTPNGKINRKALPDPKQIDGTREYIAPRSETEKALAAIWAELLDVDIDKISANDSFFKLGGHSLLTIRLIGLINEQFKIQISVRDVFENTTLSSFADQIEQMTPSADTSSLNTFVESLTVAQRSFEPAPLSHAQSRLWLLDRMQGGSAEYNMPYALEIKGQFNVGHAESAIRRVMQHQPILRTLIVTPEDQQAAVQQCMDDFDFEMSLFDLSYVVENSRKEHAQKIINEDAAQPFDLSVELPFRAGFIVLEKSSSTEESLHGVLFFNMHHIASDAWSVNILVQEFVQQYQEYAADDVQPLIPLSLQYADYARWQNSAPQLQQVREQLKYWQTQLADVPQMHSLPLDHSRPARKSYEGALSAYRFDSQLTTQFKYLAEQFNITPFMLLHGLLALVFSRHSGVNDIVIGSPVANRQQPELHDVIGFFVNMLVLRLDTGINDPKLYFSQVRNVNLDAQAHQDVPFEYLLETLDVVRSQAHTPLFQIMLTFDNTQRAEVNISGLSFAHFSQQVHHAKYDLEIRAAETEHGLGLDWVYDTALFSERSIEQMQAHLTTLLHGLIATPEQPLNQLSMLSQQALTDLLALGQGPALDLSDNKTIHQLFEAQVNKTPNNTALICQQVALSYSELNQQTNQLARLLKAKGINPGDRVGVCLERSLHTVVALLAIMKAGAAYVPMDPFYPAQRLKMMHEDAGLRCLLIQQQFSTRFPDTQDGDIVIVDSAEVLAELQDHSGDNIADSACQKADLLAYVIFTSGSTGRPKGVMVRHGNAVNFLMSMTSLPGMQADDALLAVTSISFDIHVLEIFLPLTVGAQVVFADQRQCTDANALVKLLDENAVSVMQATPATWNMMLDVGWEPTSSIRVLCGGEPLSSQLQQRLTRLSNVSLFNMYGPTETTVWSSTIALQSESQLTIGRPIHNTQFYIVDAALNLVPQGLSGELLIGGNGVSEGYLGDQSKTEKSFITAPFLSTNERVYRTGDLARFLPDGQVEFIGRDDAQVKIRGFRVELSEIETALVQQSLVNKAAVVVRTAENGHQHIVAYVILADDVDIENSPWKRTLREALHQILPDYMLPAIFHQMAQLPLTPNLKVDKQALPDIDFASQLTEYHAPETDVEQALVRIWATLLALDEAQISTSANFFLLGGNSLLATQMLLEINRIWASEFELHQVMEQQNLAALAQFIEQSLLLSGVQQISDESKTGYEELEW